MCLAIPAKIESLEGDEAVIDLAGARATTITSLTPQAKVGDWVLVHAGYAITLLDEEEARETFAILREMEDLAE
ncbi:MAG: HypC/HybG/HupF family hydrogenase formation chaperone [Phycisphaerae bacterium]|nr:HypC/HybG/HupF family hydrogenase formation chaperone [Phycisphaerae bacterium]